jgi:UDP-2,3-diacylglucosamine hydrolase
MSDGPRAASHEGSLAIICGGGTLPFAVADAARRQGRRVVLFALRGWADPSRIESYPHYYWGRIGQFGRFCELARKEGCRDVVLIGSLVRPALWQIWPDWHTVWIIPRIISMLKGGDAHLTSSVMKVFEERGFRPIGAHEVAPELLAPEGAMGASVPSASENDDIALGLALLRATAPFDVGQAAVVAGKHVLAIEAAGGTDEMLAHLAALRRKGRIRSSGGVLVKAPKLAQDRRIDLPAIGPQTVDNAARAGLAGIAVLAGESIIADAARLRQAADSARIFIVGVKDQPTAQPSKSD